MARQKIRDVIVRIRREVRQRVDESSLDAPEQYAFRMQLAHFISLLKKHDGLPPGVVVDANDPRRYVFTYSSLEVTYLRDESGPPHARVNRVTVTVIRLRCRRPGRPVIEF